MAEIRDVNAIARKWVRNSGNAGESYKEGVQNPRRNWKAATVASNAAWKAGVDAAKAADRYLANVQATPDGYQQQKAATLGADRYPGGVAASESRYAERFAPYAAVIKNTTLPARGPRGDVKNLERVKVMANALNQKRLSGGK